VHVHLRLIALVVVVAGIVGAVLALTVLNTDEDPNPTPPAATATSGLTGESGETGSTLDYAQVYPLPVEGPLLGLNLTAYSADGYSTPEAERGMKTLADLGSTAVTLVPTWYMKSAKANRIAPDSDKTPTDDSLIKSIQWARDNGLKVVIKPHVDVIDETYRGEIQPRNRDLWYRSYGEFIDHYASLAASQSADLFVIGTELKTMSSETDRWRAVAQTVRDRFYGPITYAANWDEVDQVQFWDDLDAIGVDAYYPLASEDDPTPTLESLKSAWDGVAAQLESKSEQWGRPVILTEVGYPSQLGAAAKPYEVTGQPADQEAQARAYRATFNVLNGADWLEGISWWSWRADPSPNENTEVDYTPQGKVAQGELARGQFMFDR
jgi:hypothetical protein